MNRDLDFDQARERMVRSQIEARGVSDPRVLSAMREIPRHMFVTNPCGTELMKMAPCRLAMARR